jgi:hypothetical protein
MTMGLACLLWEYVKGMRVQNKNHNILCVWIVWPFTWYYEISTPHGTTVAGIACFFQVNADTWVTKTVTFYSETPCRYWVIPRCTCCVSKVRQYIYRYSWSFLDHKTINRIHPCTISTNQSRHKEVISIRGIIQYWSGKCDIDINISKGFNPQFFDFASVVYELFTF